MDNEDFFNTGWDPHTALIQCQNNIQQCAIAINTGSELMKELGYKYNHQQEVIQQLMFQNNKLQKMLEIVKHQLVQQDTEIQLLKTKVSQ